MWISVSNWVNLSKWPPDDWTIWKEWQQRQPSSHYETSDIFQYYINQRPDFQPPPEVAVNKSLPKEYVYCFGDFTCLINTPIGPANVAGYFRLLLDMYDICKGTARFIKGDPSGIRVLREVVIKNNLTPLLQHDCRKYDYPYAEIHAHTVCQYSLSTLIMRFVMHYMSKLDVKFGQYNITDKLCQESYKTCAFGTPLITEGVDAMESSVFDRSDRFDQSTCVRCKMCKRVAERAWGKFNCCLDCHLKRICSVCSLTADVIGVDELPKCKEHQNI
jgi:hypothetical protein